MGFMARKSQLKSKLISKVWENRKDYKFLDFEFKIENLVDDTKYTSPVINYSFDILVFNCGKLILKIHTKEYNENYKWNKISVGDKRRFDFEVTHFNPQTDNDCYSINHIIAVCSEYSHSGNDDMGNAEILNNQYIFRLKESYYSYVKIWNRGDILKNAHRFDNRANYDDQLSYEFATDEYIRYVKRIFKMKKIQGRKIKKEFQDIINKVVFVEKLKDMK